MDSKNLDPGESGYRSRYFPHAKKVKSDKKKTKQKKNKKQKKRQKEK